MKANSLTLRATITSTAHFPLSSCTHAGDAQKIPRKSPALHIEVLSKMSASNPIPRSALDRRSQHDRRKLSPEAAACLEACRQAGCLFIGIQQGAGVIPDQCLFQRDQNSSTLCVDAEDISPARLKNRLDDHTTVAVQHLRSLPIFASQQQL